MTKDLSYDKKMELLRGFVQFPFYRKRKNFTSAQKAQITRYYNELYKEDSIIHSKGYAFVKVKTKKTAAFEYAGYDKKKFPKIKAIPIPYVAAHGKPKIKITKKGIVIKDKAFTRTIRLFDKEKIALDPKKEVNRKTKGDKKGTQYGILCGKFEYTNISPKGGITDEIIRMQNTYQNSSDWLNGLTVYEFENQSEFQDYRRELSLARTRAAASKKTAASRNLDRGKRKSNVTRKKKNRRY